MKSLNLSSDQCLPTAQSSSRNCRLFAESPDSCVTSTRKAHHPVFTSCQGRFHFLPPHIAQASRERQGRQGLAELRQQGGLRICIYVRVCPCAHLRACAVISVCVCVCGHVYVCGSYKHLCECTCGLMHAEVMYVFVRQLYACLCVSVCLCEFMCVCRLLFAWGGIPVYLCLRCLCRVQSIVLDNKHHKEALQSLLINFAENSSPLLQMWSWILKQPSRHRVKR